MKIYICTAGEPVEFMWYGTRYKAPQKLYWISQMWYPQEDEWKIEPCVLEITNEELRTLLDCLCAASGSEVAYSRFDKNSPDEIIGEVCLEIYNDYRE